MNEKYFIVEDLETGEYRLYENTADETCASRNYLHNKSKSYSECLKKMEEVIQERNQYKTEYRYFDEQGKFTRKEMQKWTKNNFSTTMNI